MAEMWISMGPQHPMTHGLWTLKVKVDGETIVDAEKKKLRKLKKNLNLF